MSRLPNLTPADGVEPLGIFGAEEEEAEADSTGVLNECGLPWEVTVMRRRLLGIDDVESGLKPSPEVLEDDSSVVEFLTTVLLRSARFLAGDLDAGVDFWRAFLVVDWASTSSCSPLFASSAIGTSIVLVTFRRTMRGPVVGVMAPLGEFPCIRPRPSFCRRS